MARGVVRSTKEKSEMNLNEQKAALRKQIREALKRKMVEKRELNSERLCAKLKEQSFFQTAASVLFFAPLPDEIDLWPLLEESLTKKAVALPCFDSDNQSYKSRRVKNLSVEIISGHFGIREPAASCVEMPPEDLDLILVPGVAFDLNGNRLGRGKGFYDRLLQKCRCKKAGVCFDAQLLQKIPAEPHDAKVDFILTPTRCVAARR
jgi:5-formyltetrahydrofolate cyclo-ligase